MANAGLFSKSIAKQIQLAEPILKNIIKRMTYNKNEKILDVGTGPGSLANALLLKHMPSDCSIVGSDISEEMITFARSNYANERLKFKILDIGSTNIWLSWKENSFDKIFSFCCLHWVKDIRQAVENFSLLLKHNGDLATIIVQNDPYSKLYRKLYNELQCPEEKRVMRAFESLYDEFNSKAYIELLESSGLEIISAELEEHVRRYDTVEEWREFLESVNPFSRHLDAKERTELSEKAVKFLIDEGIVQKTPNNSIEYPFKMFNVHARKTRRLT